MAGQYVGVPVGGYTKGQLVQTGFAGQSNTDDYAGVTVYAPDGTPLPPGTAIPAGSWVSIGAPPPPGSWDAPSGSVIINGKKMPPTGTAQAVVTGVDIRNTESEINDRAARTQIAQDTLDETIRQNKQAFAAGERAAKRQYDLDKLQYGEQVAARQFNEEMSTLQYELNSRLADAQTKYNSDRLALDKDRLGFEREDARAGRQLQGLGMLADRSGPQDWVKYNSLVNGMPPPDPQSTQNIDVMGLLKPPGGGQPQGVPPAPAPPPGDQPPEIVTTNPVGGRHHWGEIPVGGGPFGGGGDLPINIGQPEPQPGQGPGVPPRPQPKGPGTDWRLRGASPMAVVGDRPGMRTGVEEMVVNLNPDPNDRIGVIPIGDKAIPRGVPRAAAGGVYDAGIGTGNIQVNRYNPSDLGNQPFIQKLTGQRGSRPYGAFGGQISNPRLGVSNMPWALNYKTLMELNPSEYDQAQGLYGGLGVDFRDVVSQSQRAAPTGGTLPVARYGR